MSAEEIARTIRERFPWRFEPGVSKILIDPTVSTDEVAWFARTFEGCSVIQAKSGPYLDSKLGRRAVDRAIRDANKVVRLFVHPSLEGKGHRGVCAAIRSYSEKKLSDNVFEHAADALRYLVQDALPIPDFSYWATAAIDPTTNQRADRWEPM